MRMKNSSIKSMTKRRMGMKMKTIRRMNCRSIKLKTKKNKKRKRRRRMKMRTKRRRMKKRREEDERQVSNTREFVLSGRGLERRSLPVIVPLESVRSQAPPVRGLLLLLLLLLDLDLDLDRHWGRLAP